MTPPASIALCVRRSFLAVCLVLCFVAGPTVAQSSLSIGEAGDFAVLGLGGTTFDHGTLEINSSTSLIGDVGYGAKLSSDTNQKTTLFLGTAWVHSEANFSFTGKNYTPSGGILFGTGLTSDPVDNKLGQATVDALAAAAIFGALPETHYLGTLGDNDSRVVNSVGSVNVVAIDSLQYKEDVLQLVSRPGETDVFIVNVAGDFDFASSAIHLIGSTPAHVVFNFTGTQANIKIYKSESSFRGTILAPSTKAFVEYHNPASFEGAIVAYNIDLHSDFNLTHVPFDPPVVDDECDPDDEGSDCYVPPDCDDASDAGCPPNDDGDPGPDDTN